MMNREPQPQGMRHKKFAVFILSNGRANNVITVKTLRKYGYTGDIKIICDNLDPQLPEYQKNYPDMVEVFDKPAYAKKIDTGINNDKEMRAIVYARNASYDIADRLGLTHFMQCDDDYAYFGYREEKDGVLYTREHYHLDESFDAMMDFLDTTPAMTIAFAQGGDYIGGAGNPFFYKGLTRKCMNSFFCRTDRRVHFVGKQNEDVSTYVTLGSRGGLLFTYTKHYIRPMATQQQPGGMTEAYKESGGYIKPFSSVVFAPNCIKVSYLNSGHGRIHHHILWGGAVPMIINERWKK